GRLPFSEANPMVLLERHLRTAPPPPGEFRSGLPPDLIALIERALAKDPAQRHENAAAMRTALQSLQGTGEVGVRARSPAVAGRTARPSRPLHAVTRAVSRADAVSPPVAAPPRRWPFAVLVVVLVALAVAVLTRDR